MHVFVTLIAIIAALTWGGFELRGRERAVSHVLFGFAGLFAVLLVGAFFGVY